MTQKIGIGLVLIVMVGCALTVALVEHLTDGDRVTQLAHQIADFNLPPVFQPDYAAEVLDYTVAAYKSSEGNGHLAFLQAPPGVIPDEQVVTGYMANERTSMTWSDATLIRTDERIIRDHAASLTISDRTNGEGRRYRSLNLVFQGREGTVLLVINLPVEQWDETAIEAFITSIR